jgi:mono/diheme cytochrome c family protein
MQHLAGSWVQPGAPEYHWISLRETDSMRVLRLATLLTPMLVVLSACGTAPGSAAAAAGPAPKGPPAEVTAARIEDGRRLFNNGVCVNCHGVAGIGTGNGPPLSDDTWLHGNGGYSQLVSIITDGFQLSDLMDASYRQSMPSRGENPRSGKKFTDDEVKSVAAYVWSLSHDVTTGAVKKS